MHFSEVPVGGVREPLKLFLAACRESKPSEIYEVGLRDCLKTFKFRSRAKLFFIKDPIAAASPIHHW